MYNVVMQADAMVNDLKARGPLHLLQGVEQNEYLENLRFPLHFIRFPLFAGIGLVSGCHGAGFAWLLWVRRVWLYWLWDLGPVALGPSTWAI